jgi:hypothetical protein
MSHIDEELLAKVLAWLGHEVAWKRPDLNGDPIMVWRWEEGFDKTPADFARTIVEMYQKCEADPDQRRYLFTGPPSREWWGSLGQALDACETSAVQ